MNVCSRCGNETAKSQQKSYSVVAIKSRFFSPNKWLMQKFLATKLVNFEQTESGIDRLCCGICFGQKARDCLITDHSTQDIGERLACVFETNRNQDAENHFEDSRLTEQRTEWKRLAAKPTKDFLPAERNEQQLGDGLRAGGGVGAKGARVFSLTRSLQRYELKFSRCFPSD